MKTIIMFIWLLLVASTALGAIGSTSGTGATPYDAKAQAMANASAMLPVGVAFSVTSQNWIGDDYNGYTCNITFNYGPAYGYGVYVQPYYGSYYRSYYGGTYYGNHYPHHPHTHAAMPYHSVPHATYHSMPHATYHASAGHARHK